MFNYSFFNLNLLALLLAWVTHILLGLIWFSSPLFGNDWSKLTGQKLKPAVAWIIPGLFGHLLMVIILAILINLTQSSGAMVGLKISLLCWLGFIVPMEIGELLWEKIPLKLFLLRTGNQLVGMLAVGLILGWWR
jgi:hypothetical protein